MKKSILLLLLSFTFMSLQCEPEEPKQECQCPIEGIRYISFDEGQTWSYNSTDQRTGMMFPCEFNGRETNQTYGDVFWYKTVWTCKN